jgi:hypothetical protein
MKKLFVIWMCGCGIFAFGQEVNKDFTKLLLNEQFDNIDKNWSTTFNADNLFIGQNGFYELFRRSKKSGYYLFANNAEEYSAFQLEVGLVFGDHDNKRQSAGILMMAHSETSEGLSVEINGKKEYRIVRVYKDKKAPLSGGSGSGWTKAASALTRSENVITIKTYEKVYDLYLNGMYVQSFTDIELNKGKLGVYVGPDSKVKFDYMKVLGEDKKQLVDMEVNDKRSEEESFTQIIVKLKDQINRKDKEIDDYKTKLKLCENGSTGRTASDTAVYNQKNRLQASVIALEEENEELKFKLLQMEEELLKLRDFKEGVEKGNDGDIIINLTNMVSNQKNSIETLEKYNKILNNENNSLFMETKELTKQVDKLTNNLTSEQQKNKEHMTLIDSLKKQIILLQDSITRKNNIEFNKQNGIQPEKELTEEEKLKILIEKEREERRKKKEEEERKRKEEEEKNGGSGTGEG